MFKNTLLLLFTLLINLCDQAYGQSMSQIDANIESQAVFTTRDQVPFWMWANQYGSIPLSGASVSVIGNLTKSYEDEVSYRGRDSKLFDWGAGFEGRMNAGKEVEGILIAAYAKARLAMFELKAGRTKDITGLVDTTLTSGAFSISGNALGIPKVELGIPQFYALPFAGELFAFKGNFVHGWLGKLPTQYGNNKPTETYFHQTSLYGRFGKPDWRLKLYGGFNHNAFWGNSSNYLPFVKMNNWKEFWYTLTGKVGNDYKSKTGNHFGTIDLGFQYDFRSTRLFAYRQQLYDIGGLYYLTNIADGLNGISLTNTETGNRGDFRWEKILFEFVYTKSQGGELKARKTPSGDENYYNSFFFTEGWSYKQMALGNPFMTTTPAAKEGQASDPQDFFINNRVIAFHTGFKGNFKDWDVITKLSYSINYGTYGTSAIGHSVNEERFPPKYGLFTRVNQFSGYLETGKNLESGWKLGFIAALDAGDLYEQSVGIVAKISKQF